jgi:Fe-S-cluster-containing dehydrogenase component
MLRFVHVELWRNVRSVFRKLRKTILDAKRAGRPEIKDGEFQTACSAACGSGAMVFGDINDKSAKLPNLKKINERITYLSM